MSATATVTKDIQQPQGVWKPITRGDHFKKSIWKMDPTEGDSFEDVTKTLKSGENKNLTWFAYPLRILPKSWKKALGNRLESFNNISFLKNTQCWVKWFALQELITDSISGAFAFKNGFKNTQGGFLDKLWGGAKNSAKSIFESLVCNGVGTILPLAALALFKKSATGLLMGLAVNLVGGTISSIFTQKLLDKFISPVIGSNPTATAQPDGSAPEGSPLDPTQFNPNNLPAANALTRGLAQSIIRDTDPAEMARKYAGVANPFFGSAYAGEH